LAYQEQKIVPNLDKLNHLPTSQAATEFLRVCGSKKWADTMVELRPFLSVNDLFTFSERTWKNLDPQDWLEAFSHHPKIGDQNKVDKWAQQEQSGVQGSAEQVLTALVEWNKKYEEKFGYVFLICATGKSAEEMLSSLKIRMRNDARNELQIAMGEAMKITKLRLEKLLNS